MSMSAVPVDDIRILYVYAFSKRQFDLYTKDIHIKCVYIKRYEDLLGTPYESRIAFVGTYKDKSDYYEVLGRCLAHKFDIWSVCYEIS